MTPEQFCYWLQGHLEISKTKTLTAKQVQEIRNHLNTVFKKITPDIDIARRLLTGLPRCGHGQIYC